MKKILLVLALFLLPATASASTFSIESASEIIQLNCTSSSCAATLTYTGKVSRKGIITVWNTDKVQSSTAKQVFRKELNLEPSPSQASVQKFTIPELDADTIYYLFSSGITQKNVPFKTEGYAPGTFVYTITDIESGKPTDGTIIIPRKISLTKEIPGYTKFDGFEGILEYSVNSNMAEARSVTSSKTTDSLDYGINTDGTYYYVLTGVNTGGTTYYIRETMLSPDNKQKGVTREIQSFPSDSGFLVQGSSAWKKDEDKKSYRLLAPLPGLSVLLDENQCIARKNAKTLSPDAICDVGGLINYVMRMLIGLTAVLLVVQLMITGFSYMTTDIPGIKMNTKSKFVEILLGLALALSSYLILNTINPKLVKNDTKIGIVAVGALEEDSDVAADILQKKITLPKGKVAACTVGIEEVVTSNGIFYACKTIAAKFKDMINTANKAGYSISGGGFRTHERQIELRTQNCGGAKNVFNTNARCQPPTAYPGRSRHESGLAFDLTCDGQTIKTTDNKCFIWLKKNAGSYGLLNFSKEPWHWSVDGK